MPTASAFRLKTKRVSLRPSSRVFARLAFFFPARTRLSISNSDQQQANRLRPLEEASVSLSKTKSHPPQSSRRCLSDSTGYQKTRSTKYSSPGIGGSCDPPGHQYGQTNRLAGPRLPSSEARNLIGGQGSCGHDATYAMGK